MLTVRVSLATDPDANGADSDVGKVAAASSSAAEYSGETC
jgi:hypothetical protein